MVKLILNEGFIERLLEKGKISIDESKGKKSEKRSLIAEFSENELWIEEYLDETRKKIIIELSDAEETFKLVYEESAPEKFIKRFQELLKELNNSKTSEKN